MAGVSSHKWAVVRQNSHLFTYVMACMIIATFSIPAELLWDLFPFYAKINKLESTAKCLLISLNEFVWNVLLLSLQLWTVESLLPFNMGP